MGNENNVNYQDDFTNESGSFFASEAEEPMKPEVISSEQSNSHISYPSKSCHHCRVKKKLNCRVFNCVNEFCKLAYCENCLNKHYNIVEERNIAKWTCPKCRKICKCSHCKEKGDNRRKNKQEPKENVMDDGIKKSPPELELDAEEMQNGNLKRKRSSIGKNKGDEYEQLLSFIETNRDHKKRPDESLVRNFAKTISEAIKHNWELREYTLHVLALVDDPSLAEIVTRKLSASFSLRDIFTTPTTLRKTPLHVASFYGSSKTAGFIIEAAKDEDWFSFLLQLRDSTNNTCYDVATPHIRRIIDSAVKTKNGDYETMDYKPCRLMEEDMSTQSASTTVGFEDEKEKAKNQGAVILNNHVGQHKAAQRRRRPDYSGVEKVDRAKQKGDWKSGTYTCFLNFLESDSLTKVKVYKRIGNEANWQKYCEGVSFSSQLDMGGMNYKDGIVGTDVNLYYYDLERKSEAKDWVEIAPSKAYPESLGLFSKTTLEPNSTLCEYSGVLVPRGSKGPGLVYIRCMDFEIDSSTIGNEVRFIKSTPKANVHLMTVYAQDGPHVLVCTTNYIHPGDEIILDPKCL